MMTTVFFNRSFVSVAPFRSFLPTILHSRLGERWGATTLSTAVAPSYRRKTAVEQPGVSISVTPLRKMEVV